MRNIAAFLLAAILFIASAMGIHARFSGKYPAYSIEYGTWINSAKFACSAGLSELASEPGSIPVFGSSELRHGQKSGFHSNTLLKDTGVKPVFIGKAGYQSLTHAITLGAMADSLDSRKVVLVFSMQWLKEGGVKKDAFASSFSEDNFIKFLENENIDSDTKDYVMSRADELTADNANMNGKIRQDIRWYRSDGCSGGSFSCVSGALHRFAVQERAHMRLMIESSIFNKDKTDAGNEAANGNRIKRPDWEAYGEQAYIKGARLSESNPFGMFDSVYKSTYKAIIANGSAKRPSYTADSPELADMECFFKICEQSNIEPMVIIVPFNGYWYDYLELYSEQRHELYESVRRLADKYGAACADLSDNEYAPYYFEDNSHPALKGLVDINEKIYEFCTAS